ncbi:hypothetical protein [Vibrio mediterranei]|uniref:hypothetical protein n=1 Tax=Vibrio mediterranei TaxID=689 RepID=UPI004069692E
MFKWQTTKLMSQHAHCYDKETAFHLVQLMKQKFSCVEHLPEVGAEAVYSGKEFEHALRLVSGKLQLLNKNALLVVLVPKLTQITPELLEALRQSVRLVRASNHTLLFVYDEIEDDEPLEPSISQIKLLCTKQFI